MGQPHGPTETTYKIEHPEINYPWNVSLWVVQQYMKQGRKKHDI